MNKLFSPPDFHVLKLDHNLLALDCAVLATHPASFSTCGAVQFSTSEQLLSSLLDMGNHDSHETSREVCCRCEKFLLLLHGLIFI